MRGGRVLAVLVIVAIVVGVLFGAWLYGVIA